MIYGSALRGDRVALGILASSLCLLACSTTTRAADPCDISVLPQEIQTKIAKDFPDWQIERLEHLDDEDRQLWVKAHPNECPGIAIGHFESKTELSFAVLLISKPDRKRLGFRVVAFSREGSKSPYIARLVTKWNQGGPYNLGSDEVIARVPPGQYNDVEKPNSVHTDLDSILDETLEKGAAIFYWKNDRYRELQTSE
jgi:hypothetical protein